MEIEDRSKDMSMYQPVGDDHVHAVWFLGWQGGDWMATLWEHDGEARISARIRTHQDERVFDSEDNKEWKFGAGPPEEAPSMRQALDRIMENIGKVVPNHEGERVDIDGSIDVMIKKLSCRPWCHIKKIEPA